MPDREKVIKALDEHLHCSGRGKSGYCPYSDDELWNDISDALALLKEQETQLICNLLGGEPYEIYCRECRTIVCTLCKGETMDDVKSIFKYCPSCGKAVKWDD